MKTIKFKHRSNARIRAKELEIVKVRIGYYGREFPVVTALLSPTTGAPIELAMHPEDVLAMAAALIQASMEVSQLSNHERLAVFNKLEKAATTAISN